MSMAAIPGEIDAAILDEAAAWLVQLNAADASSADHTAWRQWHDQSPQHARAWTRAERLLDKLGGLPSELAKPALNRNHNAMRREFVGKLAVILAIGPAAWTTWHFGPEWSADYRTGTGEQKQLTLADGSSVMLNTSTALDVRFDMRRRRLDLIRGEILIETARDDQLPVRPFLVESAEGRMRAIGTRFSVQQLEGETRLTVLQGAVEVRPWDAPGQGSIVDAGESTLFSRQRIGEPIPAGENNVAWKQGMLIADAMPLGDLLNELSRYRRGVLRCDPRVEMLPVSGAFPIDDTERSLSMLQTTYPLRVQYATRYWVNISGR
jgi:transmembrane sensor